MPRLGPRWNRLPLDGDRVKPCRAGVLTECSLVLRFRSVDPPPVNHGSGKSGVAGLREGPKFRTRCMHKVKIVEMVHAVPESTAPANGIRHRTLGTGHVYLGPDTLSQSFTLGRVPTFVQVSGHKRCVE